MSVSLAPDNFWNMTFSYVDFWCKDLCTSWWLGVLAKGMHSNFLLILCESHGCPGASGGGLNPLPLWSCPWCHNCVFLCYMCVSYFVVERVTKISLWVWSYDVVYRLFSLVCWSVFCRLGRYITKRNYLAIVVLVFSARCNIYTSRLGLCYDVSVRLSVCDGSALAHYS